MIIAIVAVVALLAGASIGLTAFGVALAVMFSELHKDYKALAREQMNAEHAKRILAEMERDGLKKQFDAQANAIEQNALPWIPKTDKLEARYENEALDKMENPSFYADVIDGLGR